MGGIIDFIANFFGYILNFFYELVKNYGLAIILFTLVLRVVLLPLTIKQQTTMRKSAKIQGKLKKIQEKYKGNQEKINKETMALYKSENMSPFSGCLSAIIQILLLLSVFYLVSRPLTHMKRIDPTVIQSYTDEIKQDENSQKSNYPEIDIIKAKGPVDERVNINMHFLGLDLSSVPSGSWKDPRVYVIPLLYVVSSVVSMRLMTNMNSKNKEKDKEDDKEIEVGDKPKEKTEMDMAESMNKNMMYIMPVMSVIISFIAPLGLALYWLINNLLMIVERIVIFKYLEEKEKKNNA
ncbi:MAG: YidC/Oxa1 family membrane protein insertase [Oscillospiraceae bacterium]|nr:YidC/Oxa1 family membrane protein insertase [Oscillospiraceae bacterium]